MKHFSSQVLLDFWTAEHKDKGIFMNRGAEKPDTL